MLAVFSGAAPHALGKVCAPEKLASGVFLPPIELHAWPDAPPAPVSQGIDDYEPPFFVSDRSIGMNWYAYANGDPLLGIDPSGLATTLHSYETIDPAMSNMATVALGRVGSTDYSRFDTWNGQYFGQHKCNLFTYDVASGAGIRPPVFNEPLVTRTYTPQYYGPAPQTTSAYIPPASPVTVTTGGPRPARPSEFVNPSVSISRWSAPVAVTNPSAGAMISNGTHIGIATGTGTTVSARSNHYLPAISGLFGDVVNNDWPRAGDGTIYTRYPMQTQYYFMTSTSSPSRK